MLFSNLRPPGRSATGLIEPVRTPQPVLSGRCPVCENVALRLMVADETVELVGKRRFWNALRAPIGEEPFILYILDVYDGSEFDQRATDCLKATALSLLPIEEPRTAP